MRKVAKMEIMTLTIYAMNINLDKSSHEQEESDLLVPLPQHFRCACHTQGILAKNDVEKMVEISGTSFKKIYRKAMGKCSLL